MRYIFSDQFKYSTWRELWLALAKAEQKMGLSISDAQIEEIAKHLNDIDFEKIHEYEKKTRHDVMAHLHGLGDLCPKAKKILHLGATSAYVTDNTDLIRIQKGLQLLNAKLVTLLTLMKKLTQKYAELTCLSYTHFQPAQPTTLGKRICVWLQDFFIDFQELTQKEKSLPFLGAKGATGTGDSFLTLFDQDENKVFKLDHLVAKEMGFSNLLTISTQTYTRKIDMNIFSALEGFAASAHKCATDLRLLAHLKEVEEGHGEKQVGSSAMPHKRNPILAERICALSRFLISLSSNPTYTFANQWLERSLDDSANRRLVLSEGFLCADAILDLLISIFSNLQVYPKVIEQNLEKELPHLALEKMLMLAVKKGGDRQEVHEMLREHKNKAEDKQKLLESLKKDTKLGLSSDEIESSLKPSTGLSTSQVELFIKDTLDPFLKKYEHVDETLEEIEV